MGPPSRRLPRTSVASPRGPDPRPGLRIYSRREGRSPDQGGQCFVFPTIRSVRFASEGRCRRPRCCTRGMRPPTLDDADLANEAPPAKFRPNKLILITSGSACVGPRARSRKCPFWASDGTRRALAGGRDPGRACPTVDIRVGPVAHGHVGAAGRNELVELASGPRRRRRAHLAN